MPFEPAVTGGRGSLQAGEEGGEDALTGDCLVWDRVQTLPPVTPPLPPRPWQSRKQVVSISWKGLGKKESRSPA